MTLYLCLPLLVVLLQPALCLYNCSSEYKRTPDNSDLAVECGTSMITLEINLCTAQWAGFNSTDLALNGNHNTTMCLGDVDNSVNPPVIRYQLHVNHSQDNPCRQSLQVRMRLSVIITGYIDTPRADQGLISYSTDLYYHFSCRYPLEYLINNTQIVADNNGTFIDTLKMGVFNDTDFTILIFHVLLDHCFGTPTAYNMSHSEQHNFFTGCSVDQRTSVTSNGLSKTARFNFEAFRFVQHRDQAKSSIYLHCIMRLCEPSKCQELLSVSLESNGKATSNGTPW
uniref:Si:dkey-103g5.3 n=1 Tax=Dicentrarchus labrax TaxID=13489 RepID=A0A8C4GSA6_DICLA